VNFSIFLTLSQNIALLLATLLIFDVLIRQDNFIRPMLPRRLAAGLFLGGVGVLLIATPWTFAEGIIFDTRSVLLSISGLYFGALPTVVAMLVTAAYRLWLGGDAALTGMLVILATGCLGLLWRHARRRQLEQMPLWEVYLFGLAVSLVMLALMFTLPLPTALEVLRAISLPVLLIYPFGTLALGVLLTNRLRRERLSRENQQQVEYLSQAVEFFQGNYASQEQFLTAALDKALQMTASCMGYIFLYNEEQSDYPVAVFSESARAMLPAADALECFELVSGGLWAEVTRQKKPVLVNDFQRDHPLKKSFPQSRVTPTRFLSVPVLRQDRVVAVIGVSNAEQEYTPQDVLRLSLFMDGAWKGARRFEMEERVRLQAAALESAANAVVITDPQGSIEWVNPAFTRSTGYTLEEVLGRNPRILQSGQHDQVFYHHLWTTLLAGQVWHGEMINRRKDGSLILEDVVITPLRGGDGQIHHFIAIRQDITARRAAEQAARESEQRFQVIADSAPVMIWMTDANGGVAYFNRTWQEFTGHFQDEDLFFGWTDGLHPDEREAVLNEYLRYVEKHEPYTFVYRLRRADGEYRWLRETGAPRFSPTSEFLGFVGTCFDITEQRQHEQLLQTIASISQALTHAVNAQSVYTILLDEVMRLLDVEAAAVEMITPDDGRIITTAAAGIWQPLSASAVSPVGAVSARVLADGKPFLNNDLPSRPDLFRADLCEDCRAAASAPLEVDYQRLGVLSIGSLRPIQAEKLGLLVAVAEIAAGVIYRDELYQRIERNVSRLGALRIIDSAIIEGLEFKKVMRVILEQTTHQMRADAAAIFLFNQRTSTLEYSADYGFWTRKIERVLMRLGESHAGQAALKRSTLIFNNLEEHRANIRPFMLDEEKFVTQVVSPLSAKGELIGALELFFRADFQPGTDWLADLQVFANQTAIAISSILNFEALQQSNRELNIAYEATIEGWSRAMDLRDKETENHTLRVTELTLKLAQIMGFRDEEMIHLRRGALLHDIGKLGVPDSILLKEGALTAQEWEQMRRHPQFAYEMLYPIEYLRPAMHIPYCHHEKWDGTGYPRGLRGEEIPLEARIFAVVDVFDALTSDRPYRPAWTREKAIAYIREQSGQHFDPLVVNAFLGLNQR
jgi:PAS domain S-box-containing protein/putative nucleotidyltransferase with HDIG domain